MNYVDRFVNFLFLTEGGHFMLAYIGATVVGTMPAPTAASGVPYRWAFSALNAFAANLSRAKNTKVESSPNFMEAVNIQNAKTGEKKVVVAMTPEEAKP